MASALGVSLDGEPPAKRLKEDKAEFALHGPKLVPADYTGMNFEGLIHHYRVDQKLRAKIARDEFFDLVKLFKLDDARVETPFVTNLQESGLLTVNIPKAAQPKTKGDFFLLLYAFGQFYLQVYPDKTASFLEYLAYMMHYSTEFTVQGLLRLDSELRRLYIQNPAWNWNQSGYEVARVTERHLRDKNNLVLVSQSKQNSKFSKNNSFRGRGSRGRGSASFVSTSAQPASQSSERCINFNKGWCKLGSKCYRQHICFACGDKNHKAFNCPQMNVASASSN